MKLRPIILKENQVNCFFSYSSTAVFNSSWIRKLGKKKGHEIKYTYRIQPVLFGLFSVYFFFIFCLILSNFVLSSEGRIMGAMVGISVLKWLRIPHEGDDLNAPRGLMARSWQKNSSLHFTELFQAITWKRLSFFFLFFQRRKKKM